MNPKRLKLSYYLYILYSPVIALVKISILLQLMRIFLPSRRGSMYWLVVSMIVFHICYYMASMIVAIFACVPSHKSFQPKIPGHCIGVDIGFILTGAINVCLDLVILFIPLAMVWRLQMKTKKKIGVSSVFLVGLMCVKTSEYNHGLDEWKLTWCSCIVSGSVRLAAAVNIVRTRDKGHALHLSGIWTSVIPGQCFNSSQSC